MGPIELLFEVILTIIFPIFLLIGAGVLLHKKLNFEMNTLSKLIMYFLLPAIVFVNVYKSEISVSLLLEIFVFLVLQNGVLMIVSSLVAKLCKFDRGLSATFKNTIVLNNSGNFGLPVSQLVFQHNPLGLSIQVMVMVFQNLLTHTYGLFNSISAQGQKNNKALSELLKLPIIYALLAGLLLNFMNISIPTSIWNPLTSVANAFLAVALLTLGAQVAFVKLTHITLPLTLSIIGRLIFSPIVAFIIITLLGMDGTTAQALLIASSFPSSRNSAHFAYVYNNYPDYGVQAVFISTLLSSLTVTIVILLSGILF